MLHDLWFQLRAALSRQRAEDDLDEEVRFHLDRETAKFVAQGVPPAEARRRARLEFGQVDVIKDDCRHAWGHRLFDDLRSDVRVGLRGLARNPGFTVTSALTLSIGLGGIAAMFSVTNEALFRPFPAPEPEQLVVVMQEDEHGTFPHELSYPEYLD